MNKNWNDRADKDLFFTILSVKNIGVISGAEWTTIGGHMRGLGYGFTNEGCRYVYFFWPRHGCLLSHPVSPPPDVLTCRARPSALILPSPVCLSCLSVPLPPCPQADHSGRRGLGWHGCIASSSPFQLAVPSHVTHRQAQTSHTIMAMSDVTRGIRPALSFRGSLDYVAL